MDKNGIDEVITFFSRARNELSKTNRIDLARRCDLAIALAQEVVLVNYLFESNPANL